METKGAGSVQAKPKKPIGARAPAGLAARRLAVRLVAGVLVHKRPFDQVLAEASARPEVAAKREAEKKEARDAKREADAAKRKEEREARKAKKP